MLRLLLLTSLVFTSAMLHGQNTDAKRIYNGAQESVFMIYMNDSNGQPQAMGSAFVVAPRTLITNAHVVKEGVPVLAVGPVRLPITVISLDASNDLAVLSVNADLTSKGLPVSSKEPTPGERIFAIGNPEGLEKTISEGLISGVRQVEHKTLLQITSPISHGSSGGPILDNDGEVVGVAVGMLTDGQNLNFAVPAAYVRDLLARKTTDKGEASSVTVVQVTDLSKKLGAETYSSDEESAYQHDLLSLKGMTKSFLERSATGSDLQTLTCLGVKEWSVIDESVQFARKLYALKRSPENAALLAYILLNRAEFDDLNAQIAEAGSTEKPRFIEAEASDLNEVSRLAAFASASNKPVPLYTLSLAGASKLKQDYASSLTLNEEALPRLNLVCGADVRPDIYRDLILAADKLSRSAEAESWFKKFKSEYTPSEWDWDSEGDRRDAAHDYPNAASANERAASENPVLGIDYCWAAQESFLNQPTMGEQVLDDGRRCLDASVKNTSEYRAKQFKERLPTVYRAMATVLEDRGVHKSAFEYIKESLAAQPDEPFALYEEALIFEGLERYSECVSAAQAAISSSDGKFRWMHFGLGNCLFDMEDWNSAAGSFRIAAESDKTDVASAFNLALCYKRQGFISDAKVWFQEALRRNPSEELRTKILSGLAGG